MTTIPNPTYLAAGRLIASASRGSEVGERLQMLVTAALEWAAADRALSAASDAATAALKGTRRRWYDAQRALEQATCAERAVREELQVYVHQFAAEAEASKETTP